MSWRDVLRHGLLQRRVLEDRLGGSLHLLLVGSLAALACGSVLAQVDNRVLKAVGSSLPRGTAWDAIQGGLDLAGVLAAGACCGLLWRRVVHPPEHLPRSREATGLLLALLAILLSGFLLEGLRFSQEKRPMQPWALAGRGVAALLGPDPGIEDGSAGGPRMEAWNWLFWLHAVLGMGLVALLPYSRLRHAIAAPLQQLRRASEAPAPLPAPFLLRDVLATGGFDVRFGVSAQEDLAPRSVELAACASCGRCTARCPVASAGGDLAPHAVVEALARACRGRGPADPLAGIGDPAIWSCLQCGACTEACPSLVQPHELVAEIRRGLLRTSRGSPGPARVLAGLARGGNPYGLPRWTREDLPAELGLEVRCPGDPEQPPGEWLYWVGCAATWDARVRRVVAATARLLEEAGLAVTLLADQECCTGDPARRSGEEARFQEIALANLATLSRAGVRRIVTHCPHCLQVLRSEYPALGSVPEVLHHTELLASLLRGGRLTPGRVPDGAIAWHDPCYLARFQRVREAPREILAALLPGEGPRLPADSGTATRCCGGGGPAFWFDQERVAGLPEARLAQIRLTGAEVLVTGCPFCLKMLGEARDDGPPLAVRDIAELLVETGAGRPSRRME